MNTIHSQSNEINLLKSIQSESNLEDVRGLFVEIGNQNIVSVKKEKTQSKLKYTWFGIPVSSKEQQFATSKEIEATIKNTSKFSLKIMLWVAVDNGWSSVGNSVEIKPKETKTITCFIRSSFPDGTPKLNPKNIQQVRLMLMQGKEGSTFELQKLIAKGRTSKFEVDKNRLEVPIYGVLKSESRQTSCV